MHNVQWVDKIAKAKIIMYPHYRDKPKLFLNILILLDDTTEGFQSHPRHGHAVFSPRMYLLTSPCPTLSAYTEPVSQGRC